MIATMCRPHAILLTTLLLTTGQVADARSDTRATEDDSVSPPPNQYPPITSVVPAGPVDSTAFDDWPWHSSGITGDWCGVAARRSEQREW